MMQGEMGEDLLSLRLSIGRFEPTKKRKRTIEESNEKSLLLLLQARDKMLRNVSNNNNNNKNNDYHLIRLLLLSATAVDHRDIPSSIDSLRHLYRLSSLSGDPIQRVTAHFTDALTAKLLTKSSPLYTTIMSDPPPDVQFSAFASLYRASPYFQFAHFTANQAIIEAFSADSRSNSRSLHVVDFDVSYGLQWPSLIQSLSDLATVQNPIHLRITGFGRTADELRDTEVRLSSFADGCRNLVFEFEGRVRGENPKNEMMMIQIKKNATVAVNLVFYLHTLKSYSEIYNTLAQIHQLNPSIVTLVENEGNNNNNNSGGGGGSSQTNGFLARFMESLHYFAAMFDSLDDCLHSKNRERLRIEKNHLGREIRSAVVFDGDLEKGVRYRGLEGWKMAMERCKFRGVGMSSMSVIQAKLLLKIKSHCSAVDDHRGGTGFGISERDDGKAISLGWQERHLVTATAWRPVDLD